ncbi:MAG: hypothetical protein WD757_06105 [Actinomycetota bacterium]
MTFVWWFLNSEGNSVGSSEPFEDRESAEQWMGRSWQKLLGDGVEKVELFEEDRRLYRMGLREA